ncbi:MAG TPA: hypothetical protein VGA61_09970 [Anaerolineae bacterium]
MTRVMWYRIIVSLALLTIIAIVASCSAQELRGAGQATATPTRTPRPQAAPATAGANLATGLALPSATAIAMVPAPTAAPTVAPTALPASATPEPATVTPAPPTAVPASATPAPPTAVPPTRAPTNPPAPAVDFAITELRVLGLGENIGGIEGPGAQRNILITVLDAAGNPLDGATIVNTAPYPINAVTGPYPAPSGKGPGKAELLMDHEEFRLKVASVNGTPVTSDVSHTMSLIAPLPQDIVGKLGAACATLDNCPLPPYKHYSYVITFRRTH